MTARSVCPLDPHHRTPVPPAGHPPTPPVRLQWRPPAVRFACLRSPFQTSWRRCTRAAPTSWQQRWQRQSRHVHAAGHSCCPASAGQSWLSCPAAWQGACSQLHVRLGASCAVPFPLSPCLWYLPRPCPLPSPPGPCLPRRWMPPGWRASAASTPTFFMPSVTMTRPWSSECTA